MADRPFRVFVVAGEPSGDALGARLMAALRARFGDALAVEGVGGERMEAQGLRPLFPMSDIALMGIAEVLPRLPAVLRRIRETGDRLIASRPDVAVTIDAPDFCLRVARRARAAGIPVVHWVAPTVWAWRPGRARTMARSVDHLMCLFPFEPPYFEREGLPATFVGHPVVEGGAGRGDGARFRAAHGIAADAPVLAVLPGSRRGEVARLLPLFRETLALLAAGRPGLVAAVPTVATVEDAVRAAAADWPVPAVVLRGEEAKHDAFAAAAAAMACSGTVALELALAGLPGVVTYRASPVTAAVVRRMIRVRHVNLVNIMHGREVVPELLQERATPGNLAGAVGRLLDDPAARDAQRADLAAVAGWLGRGGPPPGERAADVVAAVAGRS
jgi:lipid-A-disaccharide synthase